MHHAKSGEIVDLSPFAENLRSAQTTALVKADSFAVVRPIVHAGAKSRRSALFYSEMVPLTGLEPVTPALRMRCSTS